MVTLFCAVVGVKGNAFPVDIEASKSVGHLKEAIATKQKYEFAASKLELFLAKKDGAWLTEKEVKQGADTNGLKHLSAARAKLRSVGLSDEQVKVDEDMEAEEAEGNGPVNVLVVVPTQRKQSQVDESVLLARETKILQLRMQMQLDHLAASLPHKNSKSYTDGVLGQLELERLKKEGLFVDVPPTDDGEAFWSAEIQREVKAIRNEADFDAFVTPFFSAMLSRFDLVFVNSERYQWLSQSTHVTKSTDLKPDGFATHRGMFRAKPVPKDGVSRPDGFRFGVAVEELFDCLILFESKLNINPAAFGQVVRYFQSLCPNGSASAILFDPVSFWLIKSYKAIVVKIQASTWTNKGSKPLFENFIAANISPWVTSLTHACSSLGVDVVEGDAFLGRGAYGRVFKVTRPNKEELALKIVEKYFVGRLHQEEKALANAQRTSLTISPVGELIETPEGAALLLSPVGTPMPQPRTQEELQNLFDLLWELHANDLVHGDPRVPNVILYEKKRLWIDLVEVREASPILKRVDAEILTRSILGVSPTLELDPTLVALIDNYGDGENLHRLTNAVSEILGFSN